jgi:hypothetical protein
MQYSISPYNIQIKSSYEVSKEDFGIELNALREQHPDRQACLAVY